MSEDLNKSALDYHRYPKPGKLEIRATKPLANQRDLALAYSPGVAAACREIEQHPATAAEYTARGNLVAVVTNGTAVLGLGAIGGLAAKPVMEGKAVLFKAFADIDVFDIELDEHDPQKIVETVARMEPTFGAINLEDIKAPDCFVIEEELRRRMAIPVFHDDQHGTAIVVGAAVYNGLRVVDKAIENVKLVASGAGAAALACLNQLLSLGLRRENVIVTDINGVVFKGRTEDMDPYKAKFAVETPHRTLEQALEGADIFLGLSAGGVLQADWLTKMAARPLILALANPTPEILPEDARAVRPDAVMATGRTDYPNQVNNVLCFPFLFRGALDCGATEINEAMKTACVKAVADLATAEPSDIVRSAYGGQKLKFGPEYLIPKPFDPRLLETVAPAIAEAAIASGVATRPIADLDAYRSRLHVRVFRTGMAMKPVFDQAREIKRRVIFADGENEKVLQAAQQAIEEGIATPVLIGNEATIAERIEELSLSLAIGADVEVIDPARNPDYDRHCDLLFERVRRRGFTPQGVRNALRHDSTVLAATLVQLGDADAMICGLIGHYLENIRHIEDIIGTAPGVRRLAAMNGIVLQSGTFFIADTYVNPDPNAEALAEITRLCTSEVLHFGLEPKVALLSHSNFGSHDTPSAQKMRAAHRLITAQNPSLQVEGEMRADLALDQTLRDARFPGSKLTDCANLLIMPNIDAANITFNTMKVLSGGHPIGPILLGTAKSATVVTPSITVRGILNMTALCAVRANSRNTTGA